MSEKDDYQRLASQFVDMWQKNMAAVMNDGDFIRAFLQMMQATSFSAKDSTSYGNNQTTSSPAGPSPAFDAGNAAASGLKNRLDAIEQRIGALELAIGSLLSSLAGEHTKSMSGTAGQRGSGKSRRTRVRKKNS